MKLHDKLSHLDRYPFHMPGHKRNPKFAITGSEIDITEIDGYDNLHQPKDIILDIENRLSKIYYSKKSFLLVGGTTIGILASVFAVCQEGDKIIIARNCHKSVYNACMLRHLRIVYLEPEYDYIDCCYTYVRQETVNKVLSEHKDAKAIVITSPTYEGRISNINTDIPLIIDAAHGAHLGLSHFPSYPKGDIVVSSLHKTLPALTQTAVLNICNTEYINRVKFYLDIFETSSPSYLLMNSADICCDIIEKEEHLFRDYYKMLTDFRQIDLYSLHLKYSDDISKIVISTENTNISGSELADLLRTKYQIEPEMASIKYVVLMTSVGDEKEAFERLSSALIEIDDGLLQRSETPQHKPPVPKDVITIEEIRETRETELKSAVGKICGEFVYAYPPDIPILVPNEVITAQAVSYLRSLTESGVTVISDSGLLPNKVLTKAD